MRKPLTLALALGLVSLGAVAYGSPAFALPKTCGETWDTCVQNSTKCSNQDRCWTRCDEKFAACNSEQAGRNPDPPHYQGGPSGNPHPVNRDPSVGPGPSPGKGAGGKGKSGNFTPIMTMPTTLKPPGGAPIGGAGPPGSGRRYKAL
jgi:hypothetical protein